MVGELLVVCGGSEEVVLCSKVRKWFGGQWSYGLLLEGNRDMMNVLTWSVAVDDGGRASYM